MYLLSRLLPAQKNCQSKLFTLNTLAYMPADDVVNRNADSDVDQFTLGDDNFGPNHNQKASWKVIKGVNQPEYILACFCNIISYHVKVSISNDQNVTKISLFRSFSFFDGVKIEEERLKEPVQTESP